MRKGRLLALENRLYLTPVVLLLDARLRVVFSSLAWGVYLWKKERLY